MVKEGDKTTQHWIFLNISQALLTVPLIRSKPIILVHTKNGVVSSTLNPRKNCKEFKQNWTWPENLLSPFHNS